MKGYSNTPGMSPTNPYKCSPSLALEKMIPLPTMDSSLFFASSSEMAAALAMLAAFFGLKLMFTAISASSGAKSVRSISSMVFVLGAVAGCESRISLNCS
jgi:hypothetical protein